MNDKGSQPEAPPSIPRPDLERHWPYPNDCAGTADLQPVTPDVIYFCGLCRKWFDEKLEKS